MTDNQSQGYALRSVALPYEDKIEQARAWMASRKVHQLGTEHLKPTKEAESV